MYVDACALVAILADEAEAARISDALVGATKRFTSPVAVLEAVLALSRPDKFNLPVSEVESLVTEFLEVRGIELVDLPPAKQATRLALVAAHLYRQGRRGLNLGDCLHYACAKHYRVPILATDDEYRNTDLEVVP